MEQDDKREEELFASALNLPVNEREGYLARACEDAPSLQSRIDSLLRIVDSCRLKQCNALMTSAEVIGSCIDDYRLLEVVGEGGCGVVYRAEQTAPVRREVALKIIKLGMDSKDVLGRFEAERQVLALMDHPNIAKVHDAGATTSGRPYFVMELVQGIKITDFCNQLRMPVNERVTLFMQVCQAIQHAHHKGIVHRDIKPSNVLVTLVDSAPVVKVIDFGIAKATQGRLTEETLLTAMEQFVGTPAYVSPEQTEPGNLRVDTRSDVYSLGVLLYELLTTCRPFDVTQTSVTAYVNLRERIRTEEPLRPSIQIDCADRLAEVADLYRVSAKKLIQEVRGDLDWIVLRCLEKEPVHRYQTASELRTDLQQFLRHEPIAARPHGFGYALGKLARRHRVAFGTTATILVVLMTSSLIMALMAVRLTSANRLAADVGSFVLDALSVATSDDPQQAKLGNALAAAGQARDLIGTDPFSEAAAREVLGSGSWSIDWLDGAAEQFGKALAIYRDQQAGGDLWIAVAGAQLQSLSMDGSYGEAEKAGEEALSMLAKSLGISHPKVASFTTALAFYHVKQKNYAAARTLLEAYLARLQYVQDSIDLAQLEEFGSTAPFYLRRTEQRPARIDLATLEAVALLARVYAFDEDQEEAERMARTVVAVRRDALGKSNLETLSGLRMLGTVYAAGGKLGPAADAIAEAELTKAKLVFSPRIALMGVRVCGFTDGPVDDELRPWRAEKLMATSQFAAQQSRLAHYVPTPMSDCPGLPATIPEDGVFPRKPDP